jgi:hypothetical protein
MTDTFPYKFNVSSVDYAAVSDYLRTIPSYRYTIGRREMVGELTLDEWMAAKNASAQKEADEAQDDHRVDEEAAIKKSP